MDGKLHVIDLKTSIHIYRRQDSGGVGGRGAGGARTGEGWVVEQWVVYLNLGKEPQIHLPFQVTIDKCHCHSMRPLELRVRYLRFTTHVIWIDNGYM